MPFLGFDIGFILIAYELGYILLFSFLLETYV